LAASRVRSRWMTGSGALRTGPASAAVAAAALRAIPTANAPRLSRRHRPGRGGTQRDGVERARVTGEPGVGRLLRRTRLSDEVAAGGIDELRAGHTVVVVTEP
jgi:hypothetical protein